jgi:hypothetical protein
LRSGRANLVGAYRPRLNEKEAGVVLRSYKARARLKGRGSVGILVKDEGKDLILDNMPALKVLIVKDGKHILWYQCKDLYWYIVGGQNMYTACTKIGQKEVVGSCRYKFYMNHKIIPMYSKDADMLIKVLNALNIQVKDKVVTENFCLQLANVLAKWTEKVRPQPVASTQRHDSELRVQRASFTFEIIVCDECTKW